MTQIADGECDRERTLVNLPQSLSLESRLADLDFCETLSGMTDVFRCGDLDSTLPTMQISKNVDDWTAGLINTANQQSQC